MAGETLMERIGVVDNLHEPRPLINRKSTILGLNITWLLLAWICVAGRLFVRYRVLRSPGWDDCIVVLALITTTMGLVSWCVSPVYGAGRHFIGLTAEQKANYLRVSYVCNASYAMATGLIKISLLLQYLRIYKRGTRLYNMCRYVLVFTVLWCLAYSILAWVPCVPVEAYWRRMSHPGEDTGAVCYAYGTQYVAVFTATYESHAAVNVLLDILVIFLPVPLYSGAGTSRRTRLGLVGIVVMGTLINVFSAWRFASIVEHRATTYPTFDPTWYAPTSAVMATLETATACICASIPVFWGPVMDRFPQLMGGIFVTREVDVHHEDRGPVLARKSSDGRLNPAAGLELGSRMGSQVSVNEHVAETAVASWVPPTADDNADGGWIRGSQSGEKHWVDSV